MLSIINLSEKQLYPLLLFSFPPIFSCLFCSFSSTLSPLLLLFFTLFTLCFPALSYLPGPGISWQSHPPTPCALLIFISWPLHLLLPAQDLRQFFLSSKPRLLLYSRTHKRTSAPYNCVAFTAAIATWFQHIKICFPFWSLRPWREPAMQFSLDCI